MKSIIHSIILLSLVVLLSCHKEQPAASQLSFIPSRGGLPNSSIIIKGMNFSTDLTANYVEFEKGQMGKVTSATSTQLTVTVPVNATSGSISVVVNNSAHGITGNFKVLKGVVSTFSHGPYVEHLTIDPQGMLYGDSTSTGGQVITKFDQRGVASVFAQITGSGGLWGVASDKDGNIFVNQEWAVRKITPSAQVSTLAGSLSFGGNVDGTGDQARFTFLVGVTVGPDNNIYVCDQPRIRKITQSGEVATIAGLTTRGNVDGDQSVATFYSPEGIAVDGSGNIYVSDTRNFNVRKISTDRTVTTLAGSRTGQSGHIDGMGTEALFNYPQGMAIDEAGNLFVSDGDYPSRYHFYIRMINAEGYVTTILGGPVGNVNGPMESASIFGPDGIVIDSDGNIYFADTYNSAVKKITFLEK